MLDAFVSSLILLALAETGGRVQLLSAALALRFNNNRNIVGGLLVATLANCALSAAFGAQVRTWISEDAWLLFNAMAYLFAAAGMVLPQRLVDPLDTWRTGPFLTAAVGVFILQFGDTGQFLLAANALRTGSFAAAFLGAVIGILLACIPAIVMRDQLAVWIRFPLWRKISGALFGAVGAYFFLSAFRLIS